MIWYHEHVESRDIYIHALSHYDNISQERGKTTRNERCVEKAPVPALVPIITRSSGGGARCEEKWIPDRQVNSSPETRAPGRFSSPDCIPRDTSRGETATASILLRSLYDTSVMSKIRSKKQLRH